MHDIAWAGRFKGEVFVSVLFLTLFLSLVLALFFLAGFLYHHDFSSSDPLRDSLLPFQKDNQSAEVSQQSEPTSGKKKS